MEVPAFDLLRTLMSLVAIVYVLLVLDRVLGVRQDSREPPFVPSTIPYFGHVLGLFWHKNSYYSKLR